MTAVPVPTGNFESNYGTLLHGDLDTSPFKYPVTVSMVSQYSKYRINFINLGVLTLKNLHTTNRMHQRIGTLVCRYCIYSYI